VKNISLISMVAIATALSAGCAVSQPQPYHVPPPAREAPPRADYRVGIVDKIEVVRKRNGSNVAGTVVGAIVGGLIGHQIGSGRGQTAATIAGAAGGAVVGHEVQGRSRAPDETFRVTVRYRNGDHQVVTQSDIVDLRAGDRVRVEGDRVLRI
jgi:outer membrane lipoprotein SlyB